MSYVMSFIYIILIIIFMMSNHNFATSSHQPSYSNIGLVLEHGDEVYDYDNYQYTIITYYVPHINVNDELNKIYFDNKCHKIKNQTITNIQTLLDDVFTKMGEAIPQQYITQKPRVNRKRREPITATIMGGILVATGLTGLGLSLYNTNSIKDLENKIIIFENKLNDYHYAYNDMVSTQQDMMDDIQHISTIISNDVTLELNDLRDKYLCSNYNAISVMSIVANIISYIPMYTIQVNNDMISGKVTPSILPYNKIDILLKQSGFEKTYYMKNNHLLYELGIFRKTTVSHNPFIISGFLVLPALYTTQLGISLIPHTVNFYFNNDNVELNIPSNIILNYNPKYIWEYNTNSCLKSSSIIICKSIDKHNLYNQCLTDLEQSGSISSVCTMTHHQYNYTKINYIGNSVFLGSGQHTIKLTNKHTNKINIENVIITNPVVYYNKDAKYMEVDHHVRDLSIKSINITTDFTLITAQNITDIPKHIYNNITFVHHKLNHLDSKQFMFVNLSSVIVLIIIIINIYIIYKLYKIKQNITHISHHIQYRISSHIL